MLFSYEVRNDLSWDIHKLVNYYKMNQVYTFDDLEKGTFIVEKRDSKYFIIYNPFDDQPILFDDVVDIKSLKL